MQFTVAQARLGSSGSADGVEAGGNPFTQAIFLSAADLNKAPQLSIGPAGVFEASFGCAIQNGLQRNCSIQSGRGCMTSFGNSPVLSFFPMPAVENSGGL